MSSFVTVRLGLRGAALELAVCPEATAAVGWWGSLGSSSRVGCRTGIFGQADDEELTEPSPQSEVSELPKDTFGSKPLLDMVGRFCCVFLLDCFGEGFGLCKLPIVSIYAMCCLLFPCHHIPKEIFRLPISGLRWW